MVGRRPAPPGVLEGHPDRAEGARTVVADVDRVAAGPDAVTVAAGQRRRAERVGALVTLVAEVEDGAVAVRDDPGPVVHGLGERAERPRQVEMELASSAHRPAG